MYWIGSINPDALKYDRLIRKETVSAWREKSLSSPKAQTQQEKLGLVRAFQTVNQCLTENLRTNFESPRFEEGYDLEDTTDKGVLYVIYKK